jgi:hypothetical protein
LLRLAKDKYIRAGKTRQFQEAMKMLLEDHVIPNCKNLDPHEWRKIRYWTEECDALYKIYFNLILYTYYYNSGRG